MQPEVFEETMHDYDFGRVHLTTFVYYLNKGRPMLTEHHQVQWIEPAHLKSIEWAPADPERVLFVVHKEQILNKAKEDYRRVLGGELSDYGILSGSKKETNAQNL